MAFAIPKIQYKNLDTAGDVASGSGTINNIPVTTLIEVGMFARGLGIPTGALVGSKTSTSVTLASGVLATASNLATPVYFGYEILFDYPPVEESGELLETKSNISESLSGIRQTSINYIEANRKLSFDFLSPTLYALVNLFLRNSALLGDSFRYYEDKTLTPYTLFELDTLKVNPKKRFPKGVDTYIWEVPLTFRRVL